MSKVKDFTDGKIFSPLVKFIIPIFAALFLQTMYGAVDMIDSAVVVERTPKTKFTAKK